MEYKEEEIKQLVEKNYGFKVSHVKQLDGYIDKNYAITTSGDDRYILKLSTSDPLYF